MFRTTATTLAVTLILSVGAFAAEPEPESAVDFVAAEQHDGLALGQPPLAMIFESALRDSDLDAFYAPIMDELMETGEQVQGWENTGISLDEAMDDFAKEHGEAFYLDPDEGGLYIMYKGEPEDFLPATFKREPVFEGTAQGPVETVLMNFAPGLWAEVVSGMNSVGNARCNGGIRKINFLTDKPVSAWDGEQLDTAIFFYAIFRRYADLDICTIISSSADGVLDSTEYDSSGRPFVAMNDAPHEGRIVTREEAVAAVALAQTP